MSKLTKEDLFLWNFYKANFSKLSKKIEIDKDECRDKWKQVVDLTSTPMFPTVEIEGEF